MQIKNIIELIETKKECFSWGMYMTASNNIIHTENMLI